jgi:hypothetical protein
MVKLQINGKTQEFNVPAICRCCGCCAMKPI